jgi:protein-tyrosine kinase
MSRIHEALKKAAQERIAQRGDRPGTDLVDLATDNVVVPGYVAERVDGKLRPAIATPEDVQRANFESFAKRCARPAWKTEHTPTIFAGDDRSIVERFRTLRSRLYQIAAAQPLRSLLITSSLPMEGKTFIATNLAQSFIRQTDRRVLLIDADLRASRLHLSLGAPDKPGLADYLDGDADEFQVTQVGPEGNLCLIPGGKPTADPSGLLHSARMKQFVEKMSQVFDWVIIDSPPAVAVHDASVLADMCDGVLFVVRAGATDFEIAEKASAEFREKNLLGVVLNQVAKHSSYGQYYYGYGQESGGGLKKDRERV